MSGGLPIQSPCPGDLPPLQWKAYQSKLWLLSRIDVISLGHAHKHFVTPSRCRSVWMLIVQEFEECKQETNNKEAKKKKTKNFYCSLFFHSIYWQETSPLARTAKVAGKTSLSTTKQQTSRYPPRNKAEMTASVSWCTGNRICFYITYCMHSNYI